MGIRIYWRHALCLHAEAHDAEGWVDMVEEISTFFIAFLHHIIFTPHRMLCCAMIALVVTGRFFTLSSIP